MHSDSIAEIRAWHRERCFAMEQRKRSDLALGAFIRTQMGWSLAIPESERKTIAKNALEVLSNPEGTQWASVIEAANLARTPFANVEKVALKNMEKLARSLPVWERYGENIRGFGAASLAVIVGEAGDLSAYSSHSKLWKRMGVAVIGDVRQGGLVKGASKDQWIEHGYSPMRRSRMWNIGDSLIKGNRDGYYRAVYLQRKEYELSRDPEMQPIKAHRRAQRYMEKRLLKHLWQAWRAANSTVPIEAAGNLPPSELTQPRKEFLHVDA